MSEGFALRQKCAYSELFWFVLSRIRTEYGPEELRIGTLFTQRCYWMKTLPGFGNDFSSLIKQLPWIKLTLSLCLL